MIFRTSDFWNGLRIARLEFLWSEEWTCREIAADLGTTRCAVIGKVDRLGLPARTPRPRMSADEAKIKRNERQRNYDALHRSRPLKVRKMQETPHIAPPVYVGDLRIPLRDLRDYSNKGANQCRYIADEPPGPDYLACGNETRPGESYCAHCVKLTRANHSLSQPERALMIRIGTRNHLRAMRKVA